MLYISFEALFVSDPNIDTSIPILTNLIQFYWIHCITLLFWVLKGTDPTFCDDNWQIGSIISEMRKSKEKDYFYQLI